VAQNAFSDPETRAAGISRVSEFSINCFVVLSLEALTDSVPGDFCLANGLTVRNS
jgi:hypothetical protein